MEKDTIVKVVSQVKAESKKRNFTQAIDLSIALRDVNLKDPSKRFRADVLMPHDVTDDVNVCVIGDADVIARAQEAGVKHTMDQNQIENLARNPNEAKSFIAGIDYFLAIPQMMAGVGKSLGRFLGPAGKMPTVLPPNAPIDAFTGRYSRTVRLRLRQNPVLNCKVANEAMSDDDIADNIIALISEVEKKLDNGLHNIKKAYVKTTMGPAFELKL
ncbi:MAG: 50S ribosomal protein L1 [Candidatus Heimdallarchaeota archaeon]|nr:50S ribosomal protein L1 [Candidatus Heimdallarchaeota archaeon]